MEHPPRENSDCAMLDGPIIVVGAARSGTHLLSTIINLHDQVAYSAGPNYVWKYRNAWIGHDTIPASKATCEVRRYIRNWSEKFCAERGKQRLCEKTPANSLRLAFVMKIMPEARVIHIVRNGRDVAASARRKFYGDSSKIIRREEGDSSDWQRRALNYRVIPKLIRSSGKRLNTIPARDAIYYLTHFLNVILNKLRLRRIYMWGPRPPGFKQLMRSHSDVEVAPLQWRASVESVLNYGAAHPDMAYIEIKYEELCKDPINIAKKIYEFCNLEFSVDIERCVRSSFSNAHKISSLKLKLNPEEEQQVTEQIAHTLRTLGYRLFVITWLTTLA